MEQVSWIILLIIFAGLLLAVINGGWTGQGGAKQWFQVKFLGKAASA